MHVAGKPPHNEAMSSGAPKTRAPPSGLVDLRGERNTGLGPGFTAQGADFSILGDGPGCCHTSGLRHTGVNQPILTNSVVARGVHFDLGQADCFFLHLELGCWALPQ